LRKTIFMGTTKIPPSRTVEEIQRILGEYGASAIRVDYEKGEIIGVSFTVEIGGNQIPFRLPCRWRSIFQAIKSDAENKQYSPDFFEEKEHQWEEDSRRIAWRQILRWIEAQMALVETEMVKTEEVFMPYLILDKGQTLFERFQENGWQFQLEHKGKK